MRFFSSISMIILCLVFTVLANSQSETTPKLGLELLFPSQQDKSAQINDSLLKLDIMIQANAVNVATWVIAASASEGDMYIVSSTEISLATAYTNAIGNATGDWTDKENYLAQKINGSWSLVEPSPGWVVSVSDSVDYPKLQKWVYTGVLWINTADTATGAFVRYHLFDNRVILIDKRLSGNTELASLNSTGGYGWLSLNDSSGTSVITLDAGNYLFKPPAVDTATRDTITDATGSFIFNTDYGRMEYYESDLAGWVVCATN